MKTYELERCFRPSQTPRYIFQIADILHAHIPVPHDAESLQIVPQAFRSAATYRKVPQLSSETITSDRMSMFVVKFLECFDILHLTAQIK